jgi:hypothetical protein
MFEKYSYTEISCSPHQTAFYVRLTDTLDESNYEEAISRLGEQIYEESTRGTFNGSLIIIRDGMQRGTNYSVSQIRARFRKAPFFFRFNGMNIQFLTTRGSKIVSHRLFGEEDQMMQLDEIAASLIRTALKATNVVYVGASRFVFEVPSGQYTERYYRVGNIQLYPGILDDMFFFMYEKVYGIRSIVCDTWSISSLCHHIAHRLRDRYDAEPLGRLGRSDNRVLVRFLSEYFSDGTAVADEFRRITLELLRRKKLPAFVLFSAIFTGNSWRAMRRAASDVLKRSLAGSGLRNPIVDAAIVRLSTQASVFSLVTLDDPSVDISTVEAKTIIPINVQTNFPNFMSSVERPIIGYTKEYRDFYQRYAGNRIFSLHRQSTSHQYRIRHNAFHVDMERLLDTDAFTHALSEKLKDVRRPDYMIYFDTAANRKLAEAVKRNYKGEEITIISGLNWGELTSKLPTRVKREKLAERVWIIESVSVTGGTLGLYAKWIRDEFYRQPVTYLLGLNRPDSSRSVGAIVQNLRATGDGENKVIEVEQLVLPNWGKEHCPWCRERELIVNLPKSSEEAVNELFNLRLAVLEGREIVDGAFVVDRSVSPSYLDVFKFGRDSFFFDKMQCTVPDSVSDADVVCAVATTAELWRGENRDFPFRAETAVRNDDKVANTSIVGPTAFTDPILRAAIWRVFRNYELFPQTPERVASIFDFFKDILEGKVTDASYGGLSMEAILLLGKRLRNMRIDAGSTAEAKELSQVFMR